MSKVIRGLLLLSIASFLAAGIGYVVHVALGRALGPEGYGIFNTVNSLVSLISILAIAGIPLAVSKYSSEMEGSSKVLKKGLILQSVLAAIIFIFFMLGAELIAGAVGDPNLAPLIRIISLGIPLSALSGVFDCFLNGNRLFGRQTIDSLVINLGKLSAIVLVLIGLGVAGALGGYVIGALLGLITSASFCWILLKERKPNNQDIKYMKLMKFAVPTILFSLLFALLYNIDILSVKILLKSDELTGFYSAASMISRVPMFVLGAIMTVLFPTLSYSMSKNEGDKTRRYISNTLRYLLILLLPMAVIVGLTADDFTSLIYSAKYQNAGAPLSILFFGFVGIVLVQLFGTIINAEGKPMIIVAILLVSVLLSGILNFILDPVLGIKGAAIATTCAAYIGVIMAGYYINKRHKINIKFSTIAKIIAGLILTVLLWALINHFFIFKGMILLVEYGILFAAYLIFLMIIKGYEKEDLELLYGVLPQKLAEPIRKILGS